ncbi:MFS transporter [Desulfovibrio sp. OttesenSCG-928-C06]|nr:MFS transporter [Desulfovibrio sp. OttesenSCG-928-C06]
MSTQTNKNSAAQSGQPPEPPASRHKPGREISPEGRRVLLLAFGSTCCMIMGVSSIMPMVPMLAKIFGVSLPTATLVITAYALPGIIFALPFGILADRFGRKVVLLPSLALFCFAGTACAFAPNFTVLLVLRFVQGLGGCTLSLLNTTIIADHWSGPERAPQLPRVVGYNMTVLSIANAAYPTIGGLLAHFDWRLPFLLSVITLPVIIMAMRTPLSKPLSAPDGGFMRSYLSGMGQAFRNKRLLALFAMTCLTFTMLYGPIITCFPVLADQRFHASPAAIGIGMLFSALGSAMAASRLGSLNARFGPRRLLISSQVLYLVCLLVFPLMPGFWWLIVPVLFFGIGQGLNVPNVQTMLLQEAPPSQRASVMAVNAVLQRGGQTIAPVIFSFMMISFGLDWGFYAGIVLALSIAALAALTVPGKR